MTAKRRPRTAPTPVAAPAAALSVPLEALLTSPNGFGLKGASPLQRSIARAADGLPLDDLLDAEACARHFGCTPAELGAVLPALVVVVAGVRSGKSLMAAAAALRCALTADLSQLLPHEIARVAIVAPTVDNASATFRLLAGAVGDSRELRALLASEPTSETITVKRSDGRIVEIVVVAAHRGAVTLRSRWLAGFVLDEVALFGSEPSGYAVNAEELLRGGETRLVRGGQGWIISSPFGPQGLLFQLYRAHFGKPGRVLVAHAPTVAMNTAFDREQVEAIRQRDPDGAAREYDAQWTDAETALLSSGKVDAAIRRAPLELPFEKGHQYAAATDAATRGNAWTFSITTKKRDPETLRVRHVVALVRQWIGSKSSPLSPDVVLKEIAELCSRYGVNVCATDQFAADALRDIAIRHGLLLKIETITGQRKVELYGNLQTKLAEESLELPPDPVLRADLLSIRKLVGRNGISIELPRTADGRHADHAASVALGLAQFVADPPLPSTAPEKGSPEWRRQQEERLEREDELAIMNADSASFWDADAGAEPLLD